MASTAPAGAAQPLPQPSIPNDGTLSWEGDRMFNIYIYDYCHKRGFKKTARELLQEADIPADSKPPINARQGLLFEWWSVFWVLFTAKANGSGSEDALLYTQHQANQQALQRQMQQRLQPQAQGPIPGAPVGQPGGPQQPHVQRIMNGTMGPRMSGSFPLNGQMTNGSAPLQPGQMPTGPGPYSSIGGPGPQPNGIPGSGPPQTPGSTPAQTQNFQALLQSQRPLGPGGPQHSPQPPQPLQQQQPRPNGPFQPSPTMANSPQAGVPTPQQPQQQQTTPQQQHQQPPQHHAQPPMGQLGAPGHSPHMQHMNRSMLPPNAHQGLNPMNPGMQQPGNTPGPSFTQLGRPPSRANTPGQASMLQQSPSLAARQPPGSTMQNNQDMAELRSIPQQLLPLLRQELNLGDRDINLLTPAEKGRLLNAWRQRRNQKPDGTPGPGPQGMQPPNPQLRGLPQQQQPPQPQHQQQRMKRSSTSPEEHEGGRNDTSPPQKRLRPSPEQPMQSMGYPHTPQQQHQQPQGPPGAPQPGQPVVGMNHNPLLMMRGPGPLGGQGPMGGNIPQGGQPTMGNPLNLGMGQPPMGGPPLGVNMNPQHPVGHPGQPGMINSHLPWQHAQYRQQLQNFHLNKGGIPPQAAMGNSPMTGPGSTPGPTPAEAGMHSAGPVPAGPPGAPQFNRLPPQNKGLAMMPPPSPAQNAVNKDQGPNKDIKTEDTSRNTTGNTGQTPNAGGTAPPTPVPGVANTSTNQGPPSTNGAPNPSIAPSPSSLLGPPLNSGPMVTPQNVLNDTLFPPDFMQHITNSLDDFDSTIFRTGDDINFERDFGQWFNGDDVPLDMTK